MARATEVAQRAIIDTACEWLITLHETSVTAEDRQQFADWLLESPVHVREYLAAEITWSLIGEVVRREDFALDSSNDGEGGTVVRFETAGWK